jgi:DNA-binding transcriptional regulator YhcF (GntR family)
MRKLSDSQVLELREITRKKDDLLKALAALPTDRELARMYNCNVSTIKRTQNGLYHKKQNLMAKYARVSLKK